MSKKEFLEITKKHFLKFGLSEKVLGEIANLVQSSFGEDEATPEAVAERLKLYEPMAKSFQSEIDSRVARARTNEEPAAEGDDEEGAEPQPASSKKPKDTTKSLIEKLLHKVENLEKGQSVKVNNESVIAKLKELKMSDKEIEAAMFGRNFETAESAEEFVAKQAEFYEDIVKDRVAGGAGSGFQPHSSGGSYSKASMKNDIEEFNKQF